MIGIAEPAAVETVAGGGQRSVARVDTRSEAAATAVGLAVDAAVAGRFILACTVHRLLVVHISVISPT